MKTQEARVFEPGSPEHWPDWVPVAARTYLAHVAGGAPIRALARDAQVHASTILRQVRRFESLRDDPLVDDALRDLARDISPPPPIAEDMAMTLAQRGATTGNDSVRAAPRAENRDEAPGGGMAPPPAAEIPRIPLTEARIAREGARILRRLTESGAVLAVARDMEMGVVVRDAGDGGTPQRLAVVEREIAQAMALKDWIASANPGGRLARYHITASGRQELRRILAEQNGLPRPARPGGRPADGPQPFVGAEPEEDRTLRHMRSQLGDSPVTALARRQDKSGKPFLPRELVAAAERLREDFELSQAGPRIAQNWDSFLTGGIDIGSAQDLSQGAAEARERLIAALADLGPGLSDVALRCCCLLEGLESIEGRMEWSARSGKIVLRIALQRLLRHYEATQGRYAPKIG